MDLIWALGLTISLIAKAISGDHSNWLHILVEDVVTFKTFQTGHPGRQT
jgi:hypothetical protein